MVSNEGARGKLVGVIDEGTNTARFVVSNCILHYKDVNLKQTIVFIFRYLKHLD